MITLALGLDLVEFFLRVQERFKISIRQEDYAELKSIDAVASYINSLRAAS
jgi:acyl carrier protein